jgi:hypothetical protein
MNCLKGVASFCSRGQKNEEEPASFDDIDAFGNFSVNMSARHINFLV